MRKTTCTLVLLVFYSPVWLCAQTGIKQSVTDAVKLPLFNKGSFLQFGGGTATGSYNYLDDTSGMSLGALKTLKGTYSYDVNVALSLSAIPFNLTLKGSNGIYTVNQPSLNDLYRFNFDRDKYVESIRKNIKEKMSPEALAKETAGRIDVIKKKYEQGLQGEITAISSDYSKEVGQKLSLPADINNVTATDQAGLKTKLFSTEELEKYRQSQAALQEMRKYKSEDLLQNDSVYKSHLQNIKRYESLQKVYAKALSWRQKFQDNQMVKELQGNLPYGDGGINNYLKDPSNVMKTAKENFSMSSLQRLFCNVTKLDIGQSPLQGTGQFDAKNIMNNGVNAAFESKNASVGVVYGKNTTTNNWLQSGLTSNITNQYTSMTGITVGTGSSSIVKQSVSVNMYQLKSNQQNLGNNTQANYVPAPAQKNTVITLNTSLPVTEGHKVDVEFSKSFGSYNNGSYYDSATGTHSSTGSILGGGGQANYAAKISYEGNIWETDVKAFVKKVGLGYNNPGNYLLRRGEQQAGLALAKLFYNRKLSVKYSIDYKNQHFDPAKIYSFNTLTNKAQASYRFKRNTKAGITYQRNDYTSTLQGTQSPGGNNVRWQVDGAYQVKQWRKTFMNNTTISYTRLNVPLMEGENYKNTSLLLAHTTSVVLKKNVLAVTATLNKSSSEAYYFNTSQFSSDASYTYNWGNTLRLTSGTGYYANAGWNKQIGISQQLSASMSKWDADVQAGYRKAVQVIKPELANQLYCNTTIRYHF